MMEEPQVQAAPPAGTALRFDELLTPLLDRLYGTALHLTRNRADAEDLVQDAVLLACRGFHTFRPGTNFKAWMFRILTNCFYSAHRRRRAETIVELDDATEQYIRSRSVEAGLSVDGADPGRAALARIETEQVAAALDTLPEEYRVVATMYFMEDFRYQDIAEILAIPLGTVRSRLHRARRMLQKRLWRTALDHGLTATPDVGEEEERP